MSEKGVPIHLRRWLELNDPLRENSVVIFEIGTNATRVLLAPDTPPDKWQEGTFWSDNQRHQVGLDIDGWGYLDSDSYNFVRLMHFVAERANWFKQLGVLNIQLFATAWFRSLTNRDEITACFQQVTGLELVELSHEDEASLSIKSLPFINARLESEIDLQKGDLAILLDHGGGSLEISWTLWDVDSPNHSVQSHCIERFGTVRLKRDNFSYLLNGAGSDFQNSKMDISTSIQNVRDKIREELRPFRKMSASLSASHSQIKIICTGTAIRNVAGGGIPPYELHGTCINRELLAAELDAVVSKYTHENGLKMANAQSNQATKIKFDNVERKDLDVVCGLPVYLEILEALNLEELFVLGYPLRYGYYVQKSQSIANEKFNDAREIKAAAN